MSFEQNRKAYKTSPLGKTKEGGRNKSVDLHKTGMDYKIKKLVEKVQTVDHQLSFGQIKLKSSFLADNYTLINVYFETTTLFYLFKDLKGLLNEPLNPVEMLNQD